MAASAVSRNSGPTLDCQTCGKKRLKAIKRGVCLACYQTALRAVAAGKTTWEELEKKKLVAPPSAPRKSDFSRIASEKLGRKL